MSLNLRVWLFMEFIRFSLFVTIYAVESLAKYTGFRNSRNKQFSDQAGLLTQ